MRRSITILLFMILFVSGCDFPTPTPMPISNLMQADALPGPEDQIDCDVESLREAINQANANTSTEDVINLASNCAYEIEDVAGWTHPNDMIGLPVIESPIVINGFNTMIRISPSVDFSDPSLIKFGIFYVEDELTLNNVIVRDTYRAVALENRGIATLNQVHFVENNNDQYMGGAIKNLGVMTLNGCIFEHNQADAGGAIFNVSDASASLTVNTSFFQGNRAEGGGYFGGRQDWGGGAIYNGPHPLEDLGQGQGVVEINRSEFHDNFADGRGGAIANVEGQVVIVESQFVSNIAGGTGYGGAVYNEDLTTIGRSTLANNHADNGGGAYNHGGYLTFSNSTIASNVGMGTAGVEVANLGTLILHSSTIFDNQIGEGLGVTSSSRTEISNTIVADNEDLDCYFNPNSTYVLRNFNIDSDGSCTGFSLTADPHFGGVGDNGGPTRTVSLLAGSPAIDAALGPCLATDQRGVARPIGASCDVGAYEAPFILSFVPPDLIITRDPGVCLGHSREGYPEVSFVEANELGFLTGKEEGRTLREVTWVVDGTRCCVDAELLKPIIDGIASNVIGALGSIPFAGGAIAAAQAGEPVSVSELTEELWDAMQESLGDEGPDAGEPLEGFPEGWINPLPPCPASGSWAYVDRETNCRTGPGLEYPNKGALRVGEFTEVVGRHERWDFWFVKDVRVPNSYCWIWGEYAHILGDSDKLSVVIPDPPPTRPPKDKDEGPTCTGNETTKAQCEAVGGTWDDQPGQVHHCECN